MARDYGIRTLLMTDVVGSTRLWSAHPDAMPAAIERSEALAFDAVRGQGGEIVKSRGEGDSLFCTLPDPCAAARAAHRLVVGLRDEPWPAGLEIKVRAAIHCGTAHERGGDLFGPMPNRCARLREVGHGDQILLTGAARAQIEAKDGIALRDLGRHRLRDLDEPESVYQLLADDLPDDFPALRSLTCLRNNLPAQYTAFIGREILRKELLSRLRVDRLTTLTGAGGSGKTRLSLQLGAEVIEEFQDGVWFVELADVSTEAGIARAVGEATGLAEFADVDAVGAIARRLRNHPRTLLLLDNAEHALVSIGRVVAGLLAEAPDLRVVCTSREPLRLRGERVHRVPPLTVPESGWSDVERIASTEAVELFVDRARFHLPEFVLRASNATAVAEIARRLDGIPLCLEMVASHIGYLGPDQIAARLHDRFALLHLEEPGGPPRHRTMRETIAWQFETLAAGERLLLQRLAAFAGAFTLDAAEAVGGAPPLDPDQVLRHLRALVEKSLVVATPSGGEMRYRLLETIAQFVAEAPDSATDLAFPTLMRWALDTARCAYAGLLGPDRATWIGRLDDIDPSLRRALEWGIAAREEDACQMCVHLTRYWYYKGRYLEARGFLERAWSLCRDPSLRLDLINAVAVFCSAVGDHAASASALSGALEKGVPDALRIKMLTNLGFALSETKQYSEALSCFQEAYDEALRQGDPEGHSVTAKYNAALSLGDLKRFEEARQSLIEASKLYAQRGNRTGEQKCFAALSDLALEIDDEANAAKWLSHALVGAEMDSQAQHLVDVLLCGASIGVRTGQHDAAVFLLGGIDRLITKTHGRIANRKSRLMEEIDRMIEAVGGCIERREEGWSASYIELVQACRKVVLPRA